MRFTSSYKTIQGVFDSPIEPGKPVKNKNHPHAISPVHWSSTFKIGLVTYCVTFSKMDDGGTDVALYISDIDKKPEEALIKLMSQAWGRPLDYHTACDFRRNFIRSSDSIIKLGNSFKVFGSLFKIMKEYVDNYQPPYISFGALEDNRSDLYERFIEKFCPGCKYVREPLSHQNGEKPGSYFTVYINGENPE